MTTSSSIAGTHLEFLYTNHKGVTATRRVLPRRVYFGSTAWHPREQWLLEALDLDKMEDRTFALADAVWPDGGRGAWRLAALLGEEAARYEGLWLADAGAKQIVEAQLVEERGAALREEALLEQNQALLAELAEARGEVERLKAGRFTEEELQALCHEQQGEEDCPRRFAAGCVEYNRKLFGARSRLTEVDPPRGACGMRYHHADCDCGGVGGDR